MNFIICPVVNGLNFTRDAIEDFLAQDIGDIQVLMISNAPTDGTYAWLLSRRSPVHTMMYNRRRCLSYCWNRGIEFAFQQGGEYALVANNDVRYRPDFYRRLVEDGGEFVTGIGVADKKKIEAPWNAPDPAFKRPHPDFSSFLIRKSCWEKVGKFNEDYQGAYAEDAEYHVRMHRAGVKAMCLDLPFWHYAAGTLKSSDSDTEKKIQGYADANRERFRETYGCDIGTPEYEALFTEAPAAAGECSPDLPGEGLQP